MRLSTPLQVTKRNISKTGESNVYTNPKYFAEVIDLATPHINYDLDRHKLCYDYAGECCANQSRYSTIIPDSGCWFSEAWNQQGFNPFTNYTPSLGFYDLTTQTILSQEIAMQYAGIQAGIASWWGQGTKTDSRIPALLQTAAITSFRWTIYYEPESLGDPSVSQLTNDLTYIRDHYGNDPSFLRIGGRFVVFVYADGADACGMADRWKQANTVGAYLVLKVFSGYATCASQPDGWHQYSPAVAADNQKSHSYAIAPGFWKKGDTVRLARDLTRWNQNIRDMIASGAPFQLVTTFTANCNYGLFPASCDFNSVVITYCNLKFFFNHA